MGSEINIMMYVFTVAYGFFAGLCCLSFLYVLGSLCFPRICFERTDFTFFPFVYGAALFCLICNAAVMLFSVPLSKVFLILPLLMVIASLFRFRDSAFLQMFLKQKLPLLHYLIAYTVFYILACIFFPTPLSADYLPIITHGNNDIFGYITQARYLLHMDFQNIPNYDYLTSVWQRWDAGGHYFYALLSIFYAYDLMSATVPLLCFFSALIGLAIFRYCHELFQLSLRVSIIIAAIIICGPFYRYVVGNFFLASLINTLFFVVLLTETAKMNFLKQENNFFKIVCFTLPCLFLIITCYNVVFWMNTLIQCGLVCLMAFFMFFQFPVKPVLKQVTIIISSILLSAIVAILLFGPSTYLSVLKEYASANVGWPLSWISPFSMIGMFDITHREYSFAMQLLLPVIFLMLILGVACFIYKKYKQKLTLGEWAFLSIPLAAFIFYTVYFQYNVGSYRAWKFASYYIIPFAGVFWALLVKAFADNQALLKKIVITLLAIMFIGGNMFIAYFYEPPFCQFSSKYKGLEALQRVNSSSIILNMSTISSSLLAVYFIPNKKLFLPMNTTYFPAYPLDSNKELLKKSFFLENGKNCEQNHGVTIADIGCLYPSIPTLSFDKTYWFNQYWPIFLEVSDSSFSGPEPWGGWIAGKKFSIMLYAQSTALAKHPQGNIRFKMRPLMFENSVDEQQLTVTWGEMHRSSFVLTQDEWITLPYTLEDWDETSSHQRSFIKIDFDIPTAVAPSQLNLSPPSTDKRILGLGFMALEVK